MRKIFFTLLMGLAVFLIAVLVVTLVIERPKAEYKNILRQVRREVEFEGYQDEYENYNGNYNLYYLGLTEKKLLMGTKLVNLPVMVFGYFSKDNQPAIVYSVMPGKYNGNDLVILSYFGEGRGGSIKDPKELEKLLEGKIGGLIKIDFFFNKVTDRSKDIGMGWYIEDGSPKIWTKMLKSINEGKKSFWASLVALPGINIDPVNVYNFY